MAFGPQPVTFYVPGSAMDPVQIDVAHSGLRMALVNRESIRLLGEEWKVLGIYFLLGSHPEDPQRFRAYVGEVGRRTLVLRLSEHEAQKLWWSRALLITRDSTDGFTSAEIGWFEGRFYDVLNNAVACEVMNKGRPGDDSIPMKDRGVLERYVEPVMAALRACGAPPDTADQKPPPKGKKRAYYRESVKDLIDAGLLKVGTRLEPTRKHLSATALVLADGTLEVAGSVHSSVSSAAVAVSGNKSEAGWEFWGAPSGGGGFVPLFTLRDRLREDGRTADSDVVRPSAPVPAKATQTQRRKTHYSETVMDLIDGGLLTVGEDLITTRRGLTARASVLPDGMIKMGDAVFASLSTSAKAASGNSSEPGWEFWAVERDGRLVRLQELRDRLRDQR